MAEPNYSKEYDEIEQDRRAWANAITSRDSLFLPLAIAVFAFLGSQIPQFIKLNILWVILTAGGVLLAILVGTWRYMCHYTDNHVVRLYPDEVRLERELGYKKRSKYIYENLRGRSKKFIAEKIGIKVNELKTWSFDEFEKQAGKTDARKPYDLLIEVLNKYKYCSVTFRGHEGWDIAGICLVLLWLIMALVITVWFPIDSNVAVLEL